MNNRIAESILFFFLLLFLLAAPSSVAWSESALGLLLVFFLLRLRIRSGGLSSLRKIPDARLLLYPALAWAAASLVSALFA
ncbi:MAG: hypothetical protein ABIH26_10230, partial [Candidatus Eisenbacteria bacterium]